MCVCVSSGFISGISTTHNCFIEASLSATQLDRRASFPCPTPPQVFHHYQYTNTQGGRVHWRSYHGVQQWCLSGRHTRSSAWQGSRGPSLYRTWQRITRPFVSESRITRPFMSGTASWVSIRHTHKKQRPFLVSSLQQSVARTLARQCQHISLFNWYTCTSQFEFNGRIPAFVSLLSVYPMLHNITAHDNLP